MDKDPIIALDFGSSYSSLAFLNNGKLETIEIMGEVRVPMYISFTETAVLFGNAAKREAIKNPKNTIVDIKYLIGRSFDDIAIKKGMRYWPFIAKNIDNKLKIEIDFEGNSKLFFPEEILSFFITKMKECAENHLGGKIMGLLITVPASFNNAQRQAIKDAGSLAGINLLRLINEPTAAAITYVLNNKIEEPKNVLILNFGADIFDVTIFALSKNYIEAISTAGRNVGGIDINHIIASNLIKNFKPVNDKTFEKTNINYVNLLNAIEKAKVDLTSSSTACINLESINESENDFFFKMSVSRQWFEELNNDLFKSCLEIVEKAIHDSRIDKKDIEDVVLIGGSAHIPKFRTIIQSYFNRNILNSSIDSNIVAVNGAAIYAAILNGEQSNVPEPVKNMRLFDITPISVGIQTLGDLNNIIIQKNSLIPAEETFDLKLSFSSEPIKFEVLEGENPIAHKNNILEKYEINVTKATRSANIMEIEFSFKIDADGIFHLSARENELGVIFESEAQNLKICPICNNIFFKGKYCITHKMRRL